MKRLISIITALAIMIPLTINAQNYDEAPFTYVENWVKQSWPVPEIKNNAPDAFHVSMDQGEELILQKDIGEMFREIQVALDDKGQAVAVRFNMDPHDLQTVLADLENNNYMLKNKTNNGDKMEYKYQHAKGDMEAMVIVNKNQKEIICSVYPVPQAG